MRLIKNALMTAAALGVVAFAASAADAQHYRGPYAYAPGAYDAYVPGGSPMGGSYYSYGADRANPSFGPHSYDQNNPRDFQLQGHN